MTGNTLVTTTRVGLLVLRTLLIVLLAAALVAILFAIASTDAQFAGLWGDGIDGADGRGRLGFGLAMAVMMAVVALAERFLQQLHKIVESVPSDPFVLANARRLQRMAWMATGFQAVNLLTELFSERLNDLFDRISFSGTVSLEGIFLALLLFILARVFREGAAMRSDLEGTV